MRIMLRFSAATVFAILSLFTVTPAYRSPRLAPDWKPGDPCPVEIRTSVPSYSSFYLDSESKRRTSFGTMSSVHAALSTCPNITTLALWVGLVGCSGWPDRRNFPFDLAGRDTYLPALEHLSLEGYWFDQSGWDIVKPPNNSSPADRGLGYWILDGGAWKWWKWRQLPAEQQSKTNLDLWLDAMDFSKVHMLSINGTSAMSENVVRRLPPRVPSLRSLKVDGSSARDFILGLQPNSLMHLTWHHPGTYACEGEAQTSFDSVLQHHGESLRTLEWHTPELAQGDKGPKLREDQLRQIGALAPNLTSLTLDISRNGTWPWEYLRALASGIPTVTHLTLYFALGSQSCSSGQYVQPLLNASSAMELSKYLEAEKAGEKFKHIRFKAGESGQRRIGPLASICWLRGKSTQFDCNLDTENGEYRCHGWGTGFQGGRGWMPESSGSDQAAMSDLVEEEAEVRPSEQELDL
ncbi:hypothetical protein GQ53DRAFT_743232 [Thozetella sp. PMI_491]|nr:hypothetical protein GQ53DRAFT_743232 [Thozetella sp. PMI_491]